MMEISIAERHRPQRDTAAACRRRWRVIALGLVVAGLIAGAASCAARNASAEAEDLFGEGYAALQRDDYAAAVEAFERARAQAADSLRAREALYWQAFARYRLGDLPNLRAARADLERLARRYTTVGEDAEAAALAARVEAQLALRGDAAAEALIAAKARELERATRRLAHGQHPPRSQTHRLEREGMLAELAADSTLARELGLAGWRTSGLAVALGPAPSGLLATPEEHEDDIRLIALSALARMDAERALPILASVLEEHDPQSAGLRQRAVHVLGMYDSAEARRLAREAVREDPDPGVRMRALSLLGMDDSEEAHEALAAILQGAESPEMKARAVLALSQRDDPRAVDLLQAVAADPEMPVAVRIRAVQGLAPPRESRGAFLRTLLHECQEPALQETIVMAVGSHEDAATREWLQEVIATAELSPSVRERAFVWLGRDAHVRTEELIDLYARFASAEGRQHAIYVIAARADEAAVGFMLRIARDAPDPDLRRAAILWLAESDDPRAVTLFEELLAR
ncbi:MAG: hypothetical protein GF330_04970 [Candidatus Eisenbacteria bacterium]|nr:hypothetical protein [Candidatus Eisenbacteria bacterium]